MTLHDKKDDFENLINITAEHFKMLPIYIEKDYWVCYILKNLAKSQYVDNIVFKGGTSLSKAYKIIERFSEDIDLQLVNFEDSDNQKNKFIKTIENEITCGLNPLENDPRANKNGSIRKTVYSYETLNRNENFHQASKELILEINFMSTPEPHEKKNIRTYIADYLISENKIQYIEEYELEDIKVNVLDKKRTFVEKIFAVMDFSFKDNPIAELSTNIRHIYDIHQLYKDSEIKHYLNTDDFYEMASRVVVENDFFKIRAKTNYSESKLFEISFLDKTKKTYNGIFSELVFGKLPEFNLLKDDMAEIMKKIKIWEDEHRKR